MDDDNTYPVGDGATDDKLRSCACIDPAYWEMLAKALYNPAATILAVWPDGTEIVVRSGWKERGHSRVYKMPVNFVEEFEALCRAAEGAIESDIDEMDEVVAQGLAIIARQRSH